MWVTLEDEGLLKDWMFLRCGRGASGLRRYGQ